MGSGDSFSLPIVASYLVAIAAAVVVASVVAPVVWSVAQPTGADAPQVAVVTLRGPITDANVGATKAVLAEARRNDSIAAVVLQIDSPGGPVDASEEFHLVVNRTASQMPVVAYVEGVAASGGYYGIVSTDAIIVKPSSTVGSVGVIVQASLSQIETIERQQETLVRSGPDKAQINRDSIRQDIEVLQRSFVSTVMRHRGENLSLTAEEVANADVYLGGEAVENGFADRIGDLGTAVEAAAARSERIQGDSYEVVTVGPPPTDRTVALPTGEQSPGPRPVTASEPTAQRDAFEQPVTYYAVWGVPVQNDTAAEVAGDD